MSELTNDEINDLCVEIASRAYTAVELSARWGIALPGLKAFVEAHRPRLEAIREKLDKGEPPELDETVTPAQLDALWITKKAERLKRYQALAERLYEEAMHGGLSGADLSTNVREFRSYLALTSNELGQLMHRGSGEASDDTTVSYSITGVDMDTMR